MAAMAITVVSPCLRRPSASRRALRLVGGIRDLVPNPAHKALWPPGGAGAQTVTRKLLRRAAGRFFAAGRLVAGRRRAALAGIDRRAGGGALSRPRGAGGPGGGR